MAILMIGTEMLTPLQEGFSLFGLSVPPVFGAINVFIAVLLILVMIFRPKGVLNGKEIWQCRPAWLCCKKPPAPEEG